jgi:cation transport ATPase
LVKAGEIVPVDGRLDDALAVLDEATLTGEAVAVNLQAGACCAAAPSMQATPFA